MMRTGENSRKVKLGNEESVSELIIADYQLSNSYKNFRFYISLVKI